MTGVTPVVRIAIHGGTIEFPRPGWREGAGGRQNNVIAPVALPIRNRNLIPGKGTPSVSRQAARFRSRGQGDAVFPTTWDTAVRTSRRRSCPRESPGSSRMRTAIARLFTHGRGQAVRLPKEFRLPGATGFASAT
jgi:hypothetical protein